MEIDRISGTHKTTAEMKIQSTYEGWDFKSIWAMSADINNGYPTLKIDIKYTDIAVETPLPYSGDSITPNVVVTYRGNTLAENTHYTLSYSNNIYIGTATVTVTGKGGYLGSHSINFTIVPTEAAFSFPVDTLTVIFSENLTLADVALPDSNYNWVDIMTKIDSAGHGQKFDAEYKDSNYVHKAAGKIVVNVKKADGIGLVSIAGCVYPAKLQSPLPNSSTNGTIGVTYRYTGTTYGGETYSDSKQPAEAGIYTIFAKFPANNKYDSFEASTMFEIEKARGDCSVEMGNFVTNTTPTSPNPNSSSNGTNAVTYFYTGDSYNSENRPNGVGTYTVTATFATTANYHECYATWEFDINATFAPAVNPVAIPNIVYDGAPKTGVANGAGYTLSGHIESAAGTHTATATLISGYIWPDETDAPKSIQWSIAQAQRTFTSLGTYTETYSTGLALNNIILPANYNWAHPDSPLAAGQGQQHTAIYKDPSGNYADASGNVTVHINQATGTFTSTADIETKYTSTLTLAEIPLPTGYNWANGTTKLETISNTSYPVVYTNPDGNHTPANGNINVNVIKGTGTGSVSIANWIYSPIPNPSTPVLSSSTNGTSGVTYLYTGTAYDDTPYEGVNPPRFAGEYKLFATFPQNNFYNSFIDSCDFKILRATGDGTVFMADWYIGENLPSPEAESSTNGIVGVTYQYASSDGIAYSPQPSQPSNPGSYVVEATFPQTANYNTFKKLDYFQIRSIVTVPVTWSHACGTAQFIYSGSEQFPRPTATGYVLEVTGKHADAGSHVVTAELAAQNRGVVLQNNICPYTIVPKNLHVAWTSDTVFTYNKMVQAPSPSVNEPGIILIRTNTQSAAGTYKGEDAAVAEIEDETLARNYNLVNRTKNYEIKRKDLTPYFTAIYPDDFPPSADTLWVSHEVFADSTLLLNVLSGLIDYDGFATDTIKNESDNASVLKGSPKVTIKYSDNEDGNSQGRPFLSKRVETTQKATATIITDNVSADNYTPLVRPIVIMATIVEDDNAKKIFCRIGNNCVEFSEAVCAAVSGAVVETCEIKVACVISGVCAENILLETCNLIGQVIESCAMAPIYSEFSPANNVTQIYNGINLRLTSDAVVEVFNLKGNLVSRQNFGSGIYTVSFEHLPKGIYIAKVKFGNEKQTLRIAVR